MYLEERWSALIEQFKAENYALHGLTSEALLCILVKAGLSALKTQFCSIGPRDTVDLDKVTPATDAVSAPADGRKRKSQQRNVNCPTCNAPFNALAARLPFTNHAHSTLVCSVSDAIMDEHNLPMALPNGNVYSESALEQLATASANGATIVDPRTGETFAFPEDVKKVFIM